MRMLTELFARLRQWLRQKPDDDVPSNQNEDRSTLADLARLLRERAASLIPRLGCAQSMYVHAKRRCCVA